MTSSFDFPIYTAISDKKNNNKYPVKIVVFYEGRKERFATGIEHSLEVWEK